MDKKMAQAWKNAYQNTVKSPQKEKLWKHVETILATPQKCNAISPGQKAFFTYWRHLPFTLWCPPGTLQARSCPNPAAGKCFQAGAQFHLILNHPKLGD